MHKSTLTSIYPLIHTSINPSCINPSKYFIHPSCIHLSIHLSVHLHSLTHPSSTHPLIHINLPIIHPPIHPAFIHPLTHLNPWRWTTQTWTPAVLQVQLWPVGVLWPIVGEAWPWLTWLLRTFRSLARLRSLVSWTCAAAPCSELWACHSFSEKRARTSLTVGSRLSVIISFFSSWRTRLSTGQRS